MRAGMNGTSVDRFQAGTHTSKLTLGSRPGPSSSAKKVATGEDFNKMEGAVA